MTDPDSDPHAEPAEPAATGRRRRWFWPAFLGALSGSLLAFTLTDAWRRQWLSPDLWSAALKTINVMRIAHLMYVDPEQSTYDALESAAARGILGSLDFHSTYLEPEGMERFERDGQQQYVGIGVEIEHLRGLVTVTDVFPGGPAAQGGVLPGDRIVAVDGDDATEYSVQEVVNALKGEPDAPVTITVQRGHGERMTMDLVRAQVDFPRVRSVELAPSGIGYFRITQFAVETAEEFRDAVDDLKARGMRGLIIDLRGNPGGYLNAAVAMADDLLPTDALIVTTKGRDGEILQERRAGEPARLTGVPLAILIDRNSASASELLAGAWQDHGRAIVVGERSHGKGSVQSVITLDDGSGVRLTTARYYLPSGRTIHETGIAPDVAVALDPAERATAWTLRTHQALSDDDFRRLLGFNRAEDAVKRTATEILEGILAFRDATN